MKNLFKINWKFILNNRGEADLSANPDNDGGSFADAISKGLDDSTPTESQPDPQPEPTTPAVDIEGYKGPDRRSKGYEGEKRREADKVIDDPEFEVEGEQGKQKLKLSELKEAAKYLNGNKQSIAGAMKIRELATKHPEFGKLLNEVILRSFGENNQFNADFVGNSYKQLTAKAEKIEDQIDDKNDEIAQAEALLNSDEIDPDSVQAQVLKSNIAAMKATKNQLNKALSKIDELTNKFGETEKTQKEFLQKQEQEAQNADVKRLNKLYEKEVGALAENKEAYKFIDEDERKEFDLKVRDLVANSQALIKDDESFVKVIRDSFKAVYDRTRKLREAAISDYLKLKGKAPEEKKEEPKQPDPEDERSFGQHIADAMFPG